MIYAVKTFIADPTPVSLDLVAAKTMYAGKTIGPGDRIFVFANAQSPLTGLIGRGRVAAATAHARDPGLDRQTPRVSIGIVDIVPALRPLPPAEVIAFKRFDDGRPQSELNFKFYRQATDKIVGLSDAAADFLDGFFVPLPTAAAEVKNPR